MERILLLVSQMRVSIISRSKREPSISNDGPSCKIKPTASIIRPDRARLETGSSVIAETLNYQSSDCLFKDENAIGLASDQNGRTAPWAGGHQVVFGPQQFDDDLRSSGEAVALAYTNNIGKLPICEAISGWVCKISLAANEGSVSILSILAILLANFFPQGSFYKASSGRLDSNLLENITKSRLSELEYEHATWSVYCII